MFSWFMKCIAFLILISTIHYLYSFLLDTLTVPKIRDFVNKPNIRYNDIVSKHNVENDTKDDGMQNELRDFLNKIKNDSTTDMDTNNNLSLYDI